jgi:hypothetical protein
LQQVVRGFFAYHAVPNIGHRVGRGIGTQL